MDSRRRVPRIPISQIRNISFNFIPPFDSLKGAVTNLSTLGLGIILDSEPEEKMNDRAMRGLLHIEGSTFEIDFRAVYHEGNVLGCEIEKSPDDYVEKLNAFFESEIRGLMLSEVAHEYQPLEAGDDVLYREGESNCYCLVITGEGLLRRYKVSYFGNVFEGGHKRMFTACQIVQDGDFDKFSKGGRVEMLKALNVIPEDLKKNVIRYVSGMDFLEKEVRDQILDDLKKMKAS